MHTDVTDCKLVEYDFERDDSHLREQGQFYLFLETGMATWADMAHDMAYVKIGERTWTVLDFKEQRYLLLWDNRDFMLIDLANTVHYGLLSFAKKATDDDTARVSQDFQQQTIAMQRLVALFV